MGRGRTTAQRPKFLEPDDEDDEGARPVSRNAYRAGTADSPKSGMRPKRKGLGSPMPEMLGNSSELPQGAVPPKKRAMRYLGDADVDDGY